MDTPHVGMSDGRHIQANHIVLQFRNDIPEGWAQRSEGDVVRFEAQFKNNLGVQPAVGMSEFEGDLQISLRLGLRKGTLLELLES